MFLRFSKHGTVKLRKREVRRRQTWDAAVATARRDGGWCGMRRWAITGLGMWEAVRKGSGARWELVRGGAGSWRGNCDTTQINKQMTKNTTNTSQLSQSSQHPRQGPINHQKNINRRRTRYRPEHQMFFILVFLQDKFM